MRIILTLKEQMEIKSKRIEKLGKALIEIAEIEKVVKDTALKNTKEILYDQLQKVIKS